MRASEEVRNEVALAFGTIGEGETASGEICPACHGGVTVEKTLSVTKKNNVLLFNCHRASCGVRGATTIGGMPTFGHSIGRGLDQYPRIASLPLGLAEARFIATKYRLPPDSVEFAGLGWTGDEPSRYGRRVAFPIYGPDGKERGTQYRSYINVKPKAITELRNDEAPAASWYKWKRSSKTLFIVEDQMSAIKLAPYTHSLALLGTHMSLDLAEEVSQQNYDKVMIYLDNDATTKAIKMQIQWRPMIKGLLVGGLDTDIKDMDENEFQEFLQSSGLVQPEPVQPQYLLPYEDDDIPF